MAHIKKDEGYLCDNCEGSSDAQINKEKNNYISKEIPKNCVMPINFLHLPSDLGFIQWKLAFSMIMSIAIDVIIPRYGIISTVITMDMVIASNTGHCLVN